MNALTPAFWHAFRFWSKVDFSGDCWTWKGSKNSDSGYGRFRRADGKTDFSHRVAFRISGGKIGTGETIDHVKARGCTKRACCRPSHLESVSNAVNIGRAERWHSRKTHCPKGHEYTPENTYNYGGRAGRQCKTCVRARASEAYHGK